MSGSRITGVGAYLPSTIVRGDALPKGDDRLLASMSALLETCVERRHASTDETSAFMGLAAARAAIADAGVSPLEIDLVMYWAFTRDLECPSDGAAIADGIGAVHATVLAVDMGFASFLAMLKTGAAFIKAGLHRKIVIVSVANWATRVFRTDEDTGPVGDGAGAAVLELSEQESLLGFKELRDSRYHDFLLVRSPFATGTREYLHTKRIDGFQTFVGERPVQIMQDLLRELALGPEQVTWFLPLQASAIVNERWCTELGLPPAKLLSTFHAHGHLIGATTPVVLDHFRHCDPRVKRGDTLLLFGMGAGVQLIAMLWRF